MSLAFVRCLGREREGERKAHRQSPQAKPTRKPCLDRASARSVNHTDTYARCTSALTYTQLLSLCGREMGERVGESEESGRCWKETGKQPSSFPRSARMIGAGRRAWSRCPIEPMTTVAVRGADASVDAAAAATQVRLAGREERLCCCSAAEMCTARHRAWGVRGAESAAASGGVWETQALQYSTGHVTPNGVGSVWWPRARHRWKVLGSAWKTTAQRQAGSLPVLAMSRLLRAAARPPARIPTSKRGAVNGAGGEGGGHRRKGGRVYGVLLGEEGRAGSPALFRDFLDGYASMEGAEVDATGDISTRTVLYLNAGAVCSRSADLAADSGRATRRQTGRTLSEQLRDMTRPVAVSRWPKRAAEPAADEMQGLPERLASIQAASRDAPIMTGAGRTQAPPKSRASSSTHSGLLFARPPSLSTLSSRQRPAVWPAYPHLRSVVDD
nr:hypothetical protein CFP56_03734 [Quercus suber]